MEIRTPHGNGQFWHDDVEIFPYAVDFTRSDSRPLMQSGVTLNSLSVKNPFPAMRPDPKYFDP